MKILLAFILIGSVLAVAGLGASKTPHRNNLFIEGAFRKRKMKMNMNSDLTFITNEKNQTLLDRFRVLNPLSPH